MATKPAGKLVLNRDVKWDVKVVFKLKYFKNKKAPKGLLLLVPETGIEPVRAFKPAGF